MGKLRIRNLVRLANDVRRELAAPISEERLNKLQQRARDGVPQVRRICADQGAVASSSTRPAPPTTWPPHSIA